MPAVAHTTVQGMCLRERDKRRPYAAVKPVLQFTAKGTGSHVNNLTLIQAGRAAGLDVWRRDGGTD